VDERTGGAANDISVVICAYDDRRWDALVAAVESLREQTHRVREIILVIDHNPELQARAQAEIEGVRVVPNAHEPGLSGGRNTGLETALGSIVGFLDDDAQAEPDWVERLVRLTNRDGCLGAGGQAKPRWLTRRPRWLPDEFLWVVGCTYRGVPRQIAPVRNLFGSCFCIRRDILSRIEGFRIELGRTGGNRLGCEETDLCIRANQAWPGHFFLYDPDAVIHHEVPGDRVTWQYFRTRCFGEGVSKARLASLVGPAAALSTERSYVTRTLTRALAQSIVGAARDDPSRLLQAGAIVSGLAFTFAGYTQERIRLRLEAVTRRVRRRSHGLAAR
jgi:glucosyl-dolichyl phosphate glucuronosyltransferase